MPKGGKRQRCPDGDDSLDSDFEDSGTSEDDTDMSEPDDRKVAADTSSSASTGQTGGTNSTDLQNAARTDPTDPKKKHRVWKAARRKQLKIEENQRRMVLAKRAQEDAVSSEASEEKLFKDLLKESEKVQFDGLERLIAAHSEVEKLISVGSREKDGLHYGMRDKRATGGILSLPRTSIRNEEWRIYLKEPVGPVPKDRRKKRQYNLVHLFDIKESSIDGAGYGLFAARSFSKGDPVGIFHGIRRPLGGDHTWYAVEYHKDGDDGIYVDPMGGIDSDYPLHLGLHLANDANYKEQTAAAGVQGAATTEKETRKQVVLHRNNIAIFNDLWVFVTRDINCGEEMLLDYNRSDSKVHEKDDYLNLCIGDFFGRDVPRT